MYELDAKTLASNQIGGGVAAKWMTEMAGGIAGSLIANQMLGEGFLNLFIGYLIGDAVGSMVYNLANPKPVVVYVPTENREQQVNRCLS